jgi:hypothetical protein
MRSLQSIFDCDFNCDDDCVDIDKSSARPHLDNQPK